LCNHTNYRNADKKRHKDIDFSRKVDKIASVGYRIYEKSRVVLVYII
jgi:hypothetical protein